MKNYNSDLIKEGTDIIQTIRKHGFDAYFVGGCVRDYVLSLPMKDIDITTSATTNDLINIFPRLIPIGIDHGTVLVRKHHCSFEITTYRGNNTSDYSSLQEDLKRRDFTINAIAMDTDRQLIDYHNGVEDIHSGVIRAVGNPRERIHEDPLRIMRAIRFMSQFGFIIEKETEHTLKELASLLDSIAVERLLVESEKIFVSSYCKKAISELIKLKIEPFLPMFSKEQNLLSKVVKDIQPLESFAEVIAIMHVLAPHHSVSDWCNKWKCSKKLKNKAKMLSRACKKANKDEINRFLLYQLGDALTAFHRVYTILYTNATLSIEMLYNMQRESPIKNRDELAIKGNDIILLFPTKQPGQWIEQLLSQIEYKVVMEELSNDSITLKEWIQCNPPETN